MAKKAKTNALPPDRYKVLSPAVEVFVGSDEKPIKCFVTRYGPYGLPYLIIKQRQEQTTQTLRIPICDVADMADLLHAVLIPETLENVLKDIDGLPLARELAEDWRLEA